MVLINFKQLNKRLPTQQPKRATQSGLINFGALQPKQTELQEFISPEEEKKPSFLGGWLGKGVERIGQVWRGERKGIFAPEQEVAEPVSLREQLSVEPGEEAPLSKKARASFVAGVGDVLSTAGSAFEWMGAKELGEQSQLLGKSLREYYIPPEDPKEFSWKQTLNPEWWATTATRSVPFQLSLIPAAILGAYGGTGAATAMGLGAFGRVILGSLGATAVSRPVESALEAGSSYEEAVRKGMSEEEADKAADQTFWQNMSLAGLDAAEFITAFTPLRKIPGVGKLLSNRIISTGAKVLGVGLMEAGEEAIQDIIQRRALGEKTELDAQMSEAAAIGFIFGAGTGTAGSVYNVLTDKIKKEMPPKMIKEFETIKAEETKKGIQEQQATTKALDVIAETPEGKEVIEKAVEDLKTKVAEVEPKIEEAPVIEPIKMPEIAKPVEDKMGLIDFKKPAAEPVIVKKPLKEITEVRVGVEEARKEIVRKELQKKKTEADIAEYEVYEKAIEKETLEIDVFPDEEVSAYFQDYVHLTKGYRAKHGLPEDESSFRKLKESTRTELTRLLDETSKHFEDITIDEVLEKFNDRIDQIVGKASKLGEIKAKLRRVAIEAKAKQFPKKITPKYVAEVEATLKSTDPEYQSLVKIEGELKQERAKLQAQPDNAKMYVSRKYSTAGTQNEDALLRTNPFYYMGSKRAMLGSILDVMGISQQQRDWNKINLFMKGHLTDRYNNVVDLFGGSGMLTSIFREMIPSARFTLGEFDPKVVATWEQIDKRPDQVIQALKKIDATEKTNKGFMSKQKFDQIAKEAGTVEDVALKTAQTMYDLAKPRAGGLVSELKIERMIEGIRNMTKMLSRVRYQRHDANKVLDDYIQNGKEGDLLLVDPPYMLSEGYSAGKNFEAPEGFLNLLEKYEKINRTGADFISFNAEPRWVTEAEISKIQAGSGKYGKLSATQRQKQVDYLRLKLDQIEIKMTEMANKGITVILDIKPKGGARGRLESIVTNVPFTHNLKLMPEVEEKARMLFDKGYIDDAWKPSEIVDQTAKLLEQHPDNIIPPKVLSKFRELDGKELLELTSDELRFVLDNVGALIKTKELEGKLSIRGKLLNASDISNQAVADMTKYGHRKISKEDPFFIDSQSKEIANPWGKRVLTTRAFNMFRMADHVGGENGLIYNIMYRGIDEGWTKMFRMQQEAKDYFDSRIEGIDIKGWSEHFELKKNWGKNVNYQIIKLSKKRKLRITPGQRISFVLHSNNLQNTTHLVDGGFSLEGAETKIYKLTQAELDTIVNSATPDELKVVDAMSYYYNFMQKIRLNETSRALIGYDVAVVPNYYHAPVNRLTLEHDPNKKWGFFKKTLENMGMLKERIDSGKPIIVNDAFKQTAQSIASASQYHGLSEPIRSAKVLLENSAFQKNMIDSFGRDWLREFKSYISDIESRRIDYGPEERLAQRFSAGVDLVLLGGANLRVMAKQTISASLYITQMDAKYVGKGVASLKGSKAIEEMKKWSPQLRDRIESGKINREMGEVNQLGAVNRFWTGREPLQNKLMSGIKFMDLQAIKIGWEAAKAEVKAKSPNLKGDDYWKRVTERTEELVRKTQPTFEIKDRSAIGRSAQLLTRYGTKYTSIRNKMYNLTFESLDRYNRSKRTRADKGKLLTDLLIILVANSTTVWAIDELGRRAIGKKASTPLEAVIKIFGNALSFTYFVGDIFSSIVSNIKFGTYGGFDLSSPFYSFLNKMIKVVVDTGIGISQAITQEIYDAGDKRGEAKWRSTVMRIINSTFGGLGVTRLPYHLGRQAIESVTKPKTESYSMERYFRSDKAAGQGQTDLIDFWEGK